MTDQAKRCVLDTARILATADVPHIFTPELADALCDLPDGHAYRTVSRDALLAMLTDALGPSRRMRGQTLGGQLASGFGRDAAPILATAAELLAA